MKPVRTEKATGTYGAPHGLEEDIGGLPYWREDVTIGHRTTTAVCSVWSFSDGEREAIANGANVLLEIIGQEPIPPVSLTLTDQKETE